MDVKVNKEDLSLHDTGGGYRIANAEITIDKTLSSRLQRQAVIFEVLGLYLDPFEVKGDFVSELTESLGNALDQLEEPCPDANAEQK